MGDAKRQLYWSLGIQVGQSSIVMRLIYLGCQVGFTVTPHLTCSICLEAVNIQLHTLFHQSHHNSPREAREAGDLPHHGGIFA